MLNVPSTVILEAGVADPDFPATSNYSCRSSENEEDEPHPSENETQEESSKLVRESIDNLISAVA